MMRLRRTFHNGCYCCLLTLVGGIHSLIQFWITIEKIKFSVVLGVLRVIICSISWIVFFLLFGFEVLQLQLLIVHVQG